MHDNKKLNLNQQNNYNFIFATGGDVLPDCHSIEHMIDIEVYSLVHVYAIQNLNK